MSVQSFQYDTELFKNIYGRWILNSSNLSQENYNLNKSFIVIVYYESLKYTETSQVPKTTVPDILSIVGGTLGLFLGLSLLSFIEVFGFLIEAFLISIKKVKSNGQVNYLD